MAGTPPESQDLTRLLLDNGFSLSGEDLNKGEALVWAVKKNREKLVQLLLDETSIISMFKRRRSLPVTLPLGVDFVTYWSCCTRPEPTSV